MIGVLIQTNIQYTTRQYEGSDKELTANENMNLRFQMCTVITALSYLNE